MTERGWLQPSAAWLRRFLRGPELALVDESCDAERALHAALLANPELEVSPHRLDALADSDARSNYLAFLEFRSDVMAAGALEAWYLKQIRGPSVTAAPAFMTAVVHAIVRCLLDSATTAFQARAAELLFRPQRITHSCGRVLSADLEVIDLLNETAGFGDLGRLLKLAEAPVAAIDMAVLTTGNAAAYWRDADRHRMVLDLTHEVRNEVGHGISFTLQRTHSGLAALASVLETWTRHFLGCTVRIKPVQRIDDPAWRWHIGLDVHSMALLNDLYEGRSVDADRQAQLVGLFRLDFADAGDMRTDVAGFPVYLGMARSKDGVLKLKPQNLLLNLPVARPS
jgi:hypothetical protein